MKCGTWRASRACLAGLALLGMSGCGRTAAPDLRDEIRTAVTNLGHAPFYPFSETHRIGAIYLADASTSRREAHLRPSDHTNVVLSWDLVEAFERRRAASFPQTAAGRFAQSTDQLAGQLRGAAADTSHYRQSPPAAAAQASPGSLPLAAFPGYTLASVDQAGLAAFLPTAMASFLAALGLRETHYFRIQAEAVEVAELPFDAMLGEVAAACRRGSGVLAQGGQAAAGVVSTAYDQLASWRGARVRAARRISEQAATEVPVVEPKIALVWRIFYLRGIRFVVEDSRVVTLAAQLALQNQFPAGVTPPSVPQVTVANTFAPAAGGPPQPGNVAGQDAAIAALRTQIQDLQRAIGTGTGTGTGTATQFAANLARAASQGIDLVQLFDRPLAFGYQALFADLRPGDGTAPGSPGDLRPLCRIAGAA